MGTRALEVNVACELQAIQGAMPWDDVPADEYGDRWVGVQLQLREDGSFALCVGEGLGVLERRMHERDLEVQAELLVGLATQEAM